jgi:DnaJ like chaperone protein
MSYWGKILGGVAGFAMGGPIGAVVGAALGHAADEGAVNLPFAPNKIAALVGGPDQVFAISIVVLSAKLAKVDGPVRRSEIDAFKRSFRIPPESARDIARLFDQARETSDGFESYATQMGETFVDNHALLEDVMGALFGIARADGAVSPEEARYLQRVHRLFGLDRASWDRLRLGTPSRSAPNETDPYAELGLTRAASDTELRATWRQLMRENHPDSLVARGVPEDFRRRATDRVARINAAWDRIKRERRL